MSSLNGNCGRIQAFAAVLTNGCFRIGGGISTRFALMTDRERPDFYWLHGTCDLFLRVLVEELSKELRSGHLEDGQVPDAYNRRPAGRDAGGAGAF
jgi:hypothetical protein